MSIVPLRQPPAPAPAVAPARKPKPRPHAKLTDTVVAKLKHGDIVFDTLVPGFYVQRGSGAKSRASYRVLADPPTKARGWGMPKTLFRTVGRAGKLPGQLSSKEARRIAQQYIAAIKNGEDPRPKAAVAPGGLTLAEAWDAPDDGFHDDVLVKGNRSPATVRAYKFCMQRLKKWDSRPLTDIAGDKLGLKREHTRLTKVHGKTAADATISFLGRVYNHARGYTELPEWPSTAVNPNVEETDNREVVEGGLGPAELPAWWTDVQRLRNTVKREMLLFAALSGLRSNDIRTATWANLNEAGRTLFIPEPKGHRPKGLGQKGKDRSFYLPVTDAMLACAQRARAAWLAHAGRKESPLLFPGPKGCFSNMTAEYTDEQGVQHEVATGHDLRRTFRNAAVAARVPSETVARLMNHKLKSVTERYHDPGSTPEVYREAMDTISKVITEAIGL